VSPADETPNQAEDHPRPVLRVIRGDATEVEIAALLAVIAARTVGEAHRAPARRPTSAWSDRATLTRPRVRPGPGAWRASGWPR
jgi:hypothetical protein